MWCREAEEGGMIQQQKEGRNTVGWLIAALLLVIVSYNLWSFHCGYCTLSSLLALSVPAVLLLVLNFAAAVILVVIKARNRQLLEKQTCRCGATLHQSWAHCPCCGNARNPSVA